MGKEEARIGEGKQTRERDRERSFFLPLQSPNTNQTTILQRLRPTAQRMQRQQQQQQTCQSKQQQQQQQHQTIPHHATPTART